VRRSSTCARTAARAARQTPTCGPSHCSASAYILSRRHPHARSPVLTHTCAHPARQHRRSPTRWARPAVQPTA
jgi:hypothetical protein